MWCLCKGKTSKPTKQQAPTATLLQAPEVKTDKNSETTVTVPSELETTANEPAVDGATTKPQENTAECVAPTADSQVAADSQPAEKAPEVAKVTEEASESAVNKPTQNEETTKGQESTPTDEVQKGSEDSSPDGALDLSESGQAAEPQDVGVVADDALLDDALASGESAQATAQESAITSNPSTDGLKAKSSGWNPCCNKTIDTQSEIVVSTAPSKD